MYGTICHACRSRSEKVSDFLEIEIIFEVGAVDFLSIHLDSDDFGLLTEQFQP